MYGTENAALRSLAFRMCVVTVTVSEGIPHAHSFTSPADDRIRSVLLGAPLWYDTAEQVGAKRRLVSCKRLILLGCLSVCRTASTVALQILGC